MKIPLLAHLYTLAGLATFVYLAFFDGFQYNWWNWLYMIPLSVACAGTWLAYWPIRWLLDFLF